MSQRQFELVLLGATGYTGKYCAERITLGLPTDLRWAVAGRNASKLSAVVDEVKSLNPDRVQPSVEVCSQELEDLSALAKKTKLIINTVGPYHLYGTNVVEACAKSGTHYVDATPEAPWVLDMIKRFDHVAKSNNAIIIPQAGLDSAVPDMLVFLLVSRIRRELGLGTKDLTMCAYEHKTLGARLLEAQLTTMLGLFGHYSLSELTNSVKPWVQSPIPGPETQSSSLANKLFGVRDLPGLGLVTTAVNGAVNATIVERSWGLIDSGHFYGKNFHYLEVAPTSNRLLGAFTHIALVFGALLLTLAPVRWLLRKIVPQSGQNPTRESTKNDSLIYHAIATADCPERKCVFGTMKWQGSSVYDMTAVYLVEAAAVLLRDNGVTEAKLGGGLLTPATLGQAYVDRLLRAGVVMEAHTMDN